MADTAAVESAGKKAVAEVAGDVSVGASPIEGTNKANDDLIKFLYQSHGPQADGVIAALEVNTKMKREQLAYAVGGVLGAFLIFGSLAQFLCNLIGFGYPAYASVKAIRTDNKDDDTTWLTYWTVFGFLSLIDFFADAILSWFPVYYLVKAILLMYLYLPQTQGSLRIYKMYVDPMVTKFDEWMANRPDTPSAVAPSAPTAPQ